MHIRIIHNSQRVETTDEWTKCVITRQQIIIQLQNRPSANVCYNMGEPQENYDKYRKPDKKSTSDMFPFT